MTASVIENCPDVRNWRKIQQLKYSAMPATKDIRQSCKGKTREQVHY